MKKRVLISVLLAAASAGIAILAYFVLPEEVVIQFSVGSSGNSTAPKAVAILIPTALGIGGAVVSLFSKDDEKSARKSLLVSAVGIALGVLMIVINSFTK